jgi:hypothetical protein
VEEVTEDRAAQTLNPLVRIAAATVTAMAIVDMADETTAAAHANVGTKARVTTTLDNDGDSTKLEYLLVHVIVLVCPGLLLSNSHRSFPTSERSSDRTATI